MHKMISLLAFRGLMNCGSNIIGQVHYTLSTHQITSVPISILGNVMMSKDRKACACVFMVADKIITYWKGACSKFIFIFYWESNPLVQFNYISSLEKWRVCMTFRWWKKIFPISEDMESSSLTSHGRVKMDWFRPNRWETSSFTKFF